jgi:hypothetical protein
MFNIIINSSITISDNRLNSKVCKAVAAHESFPAMKTIRVERKMAVE